MNLRFFSVCVLAAFATAQKPPLLKLATLLPKDGTQGRLLEDMGDAFTKAPKGGARLAILGDYHEGEAAIVEKMRSKDLHIGLLSVVGLSQIEPTVSCLQFMPMMFRSLEELDHVKARLAPVLEKRLFDKGFVVLFWTDAGWIRFFSRSKVEHPKDLKKLRLFNWAGDTAQFDLMKKHGYDPIPLEVEDIKGSLSTGMIDAVAVLPFLALGHQYYSDTKFMLEIDWAPLVGALVVERDKWEKLAPELRSALASAAAATGPRITASTRLESASSVAAMQDQHGLRVQKVGSELAAEWRAAAEAFYPEIRGKIVPADMFDEVVKVLADYRKRTQ